MPTFTSGKRVKYVRSGAGKRYTAADSCAAMLSVPVLSAFSAPSSRIASSRARTILRAYSTSVLPASVSDTSWRSREKSWPPISSSSFLMLWLTAGCVRETRSAARVKVPSSTTARKCSSWRRSIIPSPRRFRRSVCSRSRRNHLRDIGGQPAGELPSKQRHRYEARGVEVVHELLHREAIAELLFPLREQLLDLDLAGDVAGAVRGLLQVEMLLLANGAGVEPQPAAGCARGCELSRLLEREVVRVHPEIAERPRRAFGEEHVDQLPRSWPCVEHAGLQHHLFPSGGVSLRAGVEDVVEERPAADGIGVRLVQHARIVEPVIAVRPHHLGVAVVHLGEELAGPGPELADSRAQRRLHVIANRHDAVRAQEGHVLCNRG